jgi:NAD-dependent deacetylase
VTQNVDSLHLRAGSRNLLELHGNLREARCTGCAERRSLANGLPPEEIEHACGGRFRPDIVWFGEALPRAALDAAVAAARRAEVLLIVGTSAQVQPAASLARLPGSPTAVLVEINPDETPLSAHAQVVLRGAAGELLPLLL